MNARVASKGITRTALGNAALLLALATLAFAFLAWHDDPWWPAMPRAARWWQAGLAGAAYAAMCAWIWRRTRPESTPLPVDAARLLVVHASQTGFARELAERTARALAEAGMAVELRALGDVDAARLAQGGRALFVVSTTGEGDAPDPALAFVRDVLDTELALHGLRYAVLALGDRTYANYCGFGHRLDQWLRRSGASPLFDLVEVDNGEAGALRHWQHHLGVLADAPELPDWTPVAYEAWTLRSRTLANPNSLGGAAYDLALVPRAATMPTWQAGDIAEIGPRNAPDAVAALLGALSLSADAVVAHRDGPSALGPLLARSHLPSSKAVAGSDAQALADILAPLPHREYSIASLPQEGALRMLVRAMPRADGSPGLGSGWLCAHAAIGGDIDLRIRANPNFHAPDAQAPMILVGNGTGIAGLRAHLQARIAAGARRNWLLFGERSEERDAFYRDDIDRWRLEGGIERFDATFSRDGGAHRYVQDALRAAAASLRAWVADGASLYVCGSLQGMAPGVDAVLRETLGDAQVERLAIEGRYRRDVY